MASEVEELREALKPVPCHFCGRPVRTVHVTQGAEQVHWWTVVCDVPPSQAYRDPTLCRGVNGPRKITEAEAIAAWNAALSQAQAVERKAVARCIAIVRRVRDEFLSENYAVGQPVSSFNERFACDEVARAIEDEFAIGTKEQQALLRSNPLGKTRAALASPREDEAMVEREKRVCNICTATVAEYPEGMCCHCYEMPWPIRGADK